MGDPAPKFDPRDEKNYWEPKVIQGGGEGDGRPAGQLKAVDSKSAKDSAAKSKDEKSKDEKSKDEKSNSPSEKRKLYSVPTGDKVGVSKKKGLRNRWKSLSKWKRYASIGGLVTGLVGLVIGLLLSLLPLKLQFIISNIENKVAAVPKYAVERRLEYLSTDYMLRRMGARAAGSTDQIYLGNSFVDTLYTNWKAAQYESGVFKDLGLKVEKVGNVGVHGEPASWRVTSDKFGRLSPDGNNLTDVFNSKDMRKLIRQISEEDTKAYQVIKRHNMRKILRRKHHIRKWRVFESTREKIASTYLEKKLALYRTLIENTVGRVSERYGLYLVCLLEGGNSCSDIRKGVTPNADTANPVVDEDTKEGKALSKADDELKKIDGSKRSLYTTEVGEVVDNVLGEGGEKLEKSGVTKALFESVEDFGLKKFLGYFTAAIGVMQALSHVDEAIQSGALSTIVYDKNAALYVGYATTFLTINDQIKAGQGVSSQDVQAAMEILDNFEESPLYQAEFGDFGNSGIVSADGQIYRDCDGDGSKETFLDPGELVCPNKKVMVDVEKGIRDNPVYQSFSKIIAAYRNTIGAVVDVVFNFVGDLVNAVLGDFIADLMSALHLDQALQSAFKFMLNWIFGNVITGAETGGDAYDSIRAGIELDNYLVTSGGQDGAGGAVLTKEQVAAIDNSAKAEYQEEFNSRPFFARMLSTKDNSLLMRTIVALPSNVSDVTRSIARLPMNVLSTAKNLFAFMIAPRGVLAADTYTANPFGIIQTGYAMDDTSDYDSSILDNFSEFTTAKAKSFDYSDVETADIPTYYDLDTPPDVVWKKYGCEVYVSGTPEQIDAHEQLFYGRADGIPFDVQIRPNPCLLEKAVTQASGALFGGQLD